MKVVAVSGGFDPIHVGHIRYLEAAKKLGDYLVVILNGDSFLMRKKGYKCFDAEERREILLALRCVDMVVLYEAERDDVEYPLRFILPDIFAKGGDRNPDSMPTTEQKVCEELGIEIVYGVGGSDKPNSSSWVIERILKDIGSIKK
jgi:cytidyltransferase-like protein